MHVDSRWTVQGIAQLLAIFVTFSTLLGIAYKQGQSSEAIERRVSALEARAPQADLDSRALIRIETKANAMDERMANIEKALIDLRSLTVAGSISCPNERPVLVASYCRSNPAP